MIPPPSPWKFHKPASPFASPKEQLLGVTVLIHLLGRCTICLTSKIYLNLPTSHHLHGLDNGSDFLMGL